MKKYLIRDSKQKDKYWGGDCLFGGFDLQTRKWSIPPSNHNLPVICGDGISWYDRPVVPFIFESIEEVNRAIEYVPRKFAVEIVCLQIDYSIVNTEEE